MYRLQVKDAVVKTSDYQEGKYIGLSRTQERNTSKESSEIKNVPRSSRNHTKYRECLVVQQAATSCICILICWDKPSRFAATNLCVSSQLVFITAHSKRDLQIFMPRLKEECICVNLGINSGKLHQKRKIFSKLFVWPCRRQTETCAWISHFKQGKTVWTLWVVVQKVSRIVNEQRSYFGNRWQVRPLVLKETALSKGRLQHAANIREMGASIAHQRLDGL